MIARLFRPFAAAFEIDQRALGAFRIGLALLLLLDLVFRSADLYAFYSDDGILPRGGVIDHLLTDHAFVCIHLISGNVVVVGALFLVAAAFALCLLIGIRTRLATIASWFLLASLHTRNPIILQGGDVLLRMLLFWSIFLPLDARVTVAGRKTVLSWATAALLLQVCSVYFFGALLKSSPAWRTEHSAIYYALSIEQFSTKLGSWLLHFPKLLKILTVYSRGLELLGPWIAILPLTPRKWFRTGIVFLFVSFHLAMAACLHLGMFPAICIVAWIPFIPGEIWDSISPATDRLKRLLENIFASRFVKSSGTRLTGYPDAVVMDPVRSRRLGLLVHGVVAIFLLYVLFWNVRTVNPRVDAPFMHRLDWIAEVFRFDQTWDMFAPSPLREDGWYVIPGLLADGTQVDLFRDGKPVTWEKPLVVADDYKNDRWRKYMINLSSRQHTWYRGPYSEYLRRQWNKEHPAGKRVVSLWIYYMMTLTSPDGQRDKPQPLLLWQYNWAE